jgi:sulfate transport system permease protein
MRIERGSSADEKARLRQTEPRWLQAILIFLAFAAVTWIVLVPTAYVFYQALGEGLRPFWRKVWEDPDTRHAIYLTVTVAPLAVVLNSIFGVAAAWAIARFEFRGKSLLLTLLDLPFAVSPVVAGLCFVLLFGMQGYFGPALREAGIKILFAWPALLLATMFVTMPFVVRELIPLMEALGPEEEIAAVSLGASGWQMFWRVTLPNIKWGLLFGAIQCNARAIGEFGAVYVVSGRIAGETDTMPLRVEKLFQDSDNPGAFALASVLSLMALVTLLAKALVERKAEKALAEKSQVEGLAEAA